MTDYEEIEELIKEGNKYIPRQYHYSEYTGQKRVERYFENAAAQSPNIFFSSKFNKWVLEFQSADFGGYDVYTFYYFFDELIDLISYISASEEAEQSIRITLSKYFQRNSTIKD